MDRSAIQHMVWSVELEINSPENEHTRSFINISIEISFISSLPFE